MLTLRLELLTGRYVASEYNNRDRAEWPPHPARVFSALVAANYETGRPAHGEDALRWLEQQPPPRLSFSTASARDLKTHYVPVNDKALSDNATVSRAWQAVASAANERAREKAEKRLRTAYEKAGAPSDKLNKDFDKQLQHLLPATRTRQPRTFPSVSPADPVIYYMWDGAPGPEIKVGLDALAAAIVRVGHSCSLVAATWLEDARQVPEPTLVPSKQGGQVLRWVSVGQLEALDAMHAARPYGEQRIMPFVVARYTEPCTGVEVRDSCFSPELIVFRRVSGERLPIESVEIVANAVRSALMAHAEDPVPPLISGHDHDGSPLGEDHMAVLALPFIGARHATGDLLGVAVALPGALDAAAQHPVFRAIARWETDGDASADRTAVLRLGRLGIWTLERCLEEPRAHNLKSSTWTGPARAWATATPMVLDRHPGSFRKQTDRAYRRATASIVSACERIGLPTPVQVQISDAPVFRGTSHVRRFGRRGGSSDPRPLVHVKLRFDEPVRGPVLIGAGRYRGLGLLRPLWEADVE